MAKKVTAYVNLQVKAQEGNPSPPVGPALGQHGVNIMEFCKAFNAQTQHIEKGTPCPVIITIYSDKSFTFHIKTPPASFLIKKAANVKSGSANPKEKKVGKISRKDVEAIATLKMADLTAASMAAAIRTIEGTARSAGIEVEG